MRYLGDRLVQLPLVAQGVAEVVVGLGVVGLEPERRAVLGDRLVQLPLIAQGNAEVVVGLGEVGLEADRLAVLGDRLVQLPLAAQGAAEVGVGRGESGLSRRASRYSAIASSGFPWAARRSRGCRERV